MGRLIIKRGYLVVTTFILVYVLFWEWLAARRLEPELLNRSGATLAALAALMVVWQVSRELRLEQLNDADGDATGRAPMDPQAREIAERIMLARVSDRHAERMKVVVMISIALFVGEMLHGWGEYIYVGDRPAADARPGCTSTLVPGPVKRLTKASPVRDWRRPASPTAGCCSVRPTRDAASRTRPG